MSKIKMRERKPNINIYESLVKNFTVAAEDRNKAFSKEVNDQCSSMRHVANLKISLLSKVSKSANSTYPVTRSYAASLPEKSSRVRADSQPLPSGNSGRADSAPFLKSSYVKSKTGTNTAVRMSARLNDQQKPSRAFAAISAATGSAKPVPDEFRSENGGNLRFYYAHADGSIIELNSNTVAAVDEKSKQTLQQLLQNEQQDA
ncbi:hypothetical protein CHUAL_003700 [Chamberlinius hualienensis]